MSQIREALEQLKNEGCEIEEVVRLWQVKRDLQRRRYALPARTSFNEILRLRSRLESATAEEDAPKRAELSEKIVGLMRQNQAIDAMRRSLLEQEEAARVEAAVCARKAIDDVVRSLEKEIERLAHDNETVGVVLPRLLPDRIRDLHQRIARVSGLKRIAEFGVPLELVQRTPTRRLFAGLATALRRAVQVKIGILPTA